MVIASMIDTHGESGEGTFVLCSLLRIGQLIREGQLARAESLPEELIAAASPLGLYSEDIDPVSVTSSATSRKPSPTSALSPLLDLQQAKAQPGFAGRPDHEKFQRGVGHTIGVGGVLAGSWRAPQTFRLLLSGRPNWLSASVRSLAREEWRSL